jgi:hypothetical protein
MSLLTLKSTRPKQAKLVLWPRMDQKTCLKAIYTAGTHSSIPGPHGVCASFANHDYCRAGLEVVVVENRLEGDEVRTDLEALQQQIDRIGADNIVAVVSTSSCFTPRIPDRFVFQSNSSHVICICIYIYGYIPFGITVWWRFPNFAETQELVTSSSTMPTAFNVLPRANWWPKYVFDLI